MARLKGSSVVCVITCEHASFRLPARYGNLGLAAQALRSHVAWDAGARPVARLIARRLDCPYFEGRYSRLLIDLNRSESHPSLIPARTFSVAVPDNRDLTPEEVRLRIERYWRPHRTAVERALRVRIARGRICLHVAIHSFTPVLGGRRRECDVGLLFDPRRALEATTARALRKSLRSSRLNVRFNYPYRGTSDGLTTALRTRLSADCYAGMEIEINQCLLADARGRTRLARALSAAMSAIVFAYQPALETRGSARKKPPSGSWRVLRPRVISD